jgi:hypothetical protein
MSHVRWSLVTRTMHVLRLWNGKCLKIWLIAINILNKQWEKADKGWTSSLRVG